MPFLNNDPMDRSATDLTKFGFVAGLNFTVYEWMSINYQFKVLDDPQLLDELQVQNNLLFTFSYTFIERNANLNNLADVQAAEAKEKAAADAAKKTEAAEKRAEAAEAEAKQLKEEAAAREAAEAEKKAAEEKKAEEEEKKEEEAPDAGGDNP